MELKNILSAIEAKHMKIPRKPQLYDLYNKAPAILSNQFNFAPVITGFQEYKSLKVPGKQNLAFIIGESYFLSFANALMQHVDEVVFVDIDARVLSHNLYMLECIGKSSTKEEFIRNLTSDDNPLIKSNVVFTRGYAARDDKGNMRYTKQPDATGSNVILELLNTNIRMLDEKHFLFNDELFKQAKDAASRLKFHKLEIDLLNTDLILELGMSLSENNYNITILNYSNLLDYDGNYPIREVDAVSDKWHATGTLYKSIENLVSRPEEVVIIFSAMDPDMQFKGLSCGMSTGLSEYKEFGETYAASVNASHLVGRWTGTIQYFSIWSAQQFFRPKAYNLKEKYLDSFFSDFKGALEKVCPGLETSCHFVRNTQHDLVDMLLRAPSENIVDFVNVITHLKDLFTALVSHDISYQMKNIEGKEYICILDIHLPIQHRKIMDMVEDIEKATSLTKAPHL